MAIIKNVRSVLQRILDNTVMLIYFLTDFDESSLFKPSHFFFFFVMNLGFNKIIKGRVHYIRIVNI